MIAQSHMEAIMLWLLLISFILAYKLVGGIGANATCLASLIIFLVMALALRGALYILGVQVV